MFKKEQMLCPYGIDCVCFACNKGCCYALSDTVFKNGKLCPFFKTKDEVDEKTRKLIREEIKKGYESEIVE